MDSASILFCAVILDAVIGDPPFFFHPVRIIGFFISLLEKISRAFFPRFLLIAGALTCLSLICISYFVVYISISFAESYASFYADALKIIWLWLGISAGDLDKSVRKVLSSLRKANILQARKALSQVVGRDTQNLDESEISRAAVETTAESFVDGILSPLFVFLIGGVPLLWAFKALSTCDSMIGHKDERYILFGRVSARLDDFANFAASRLSIFFIFTAAVLLRIRYKFFHPIDCLKTFLNDRKKHESPNSGHPESAFAGALGLRLGGVNYYDGERHESPAIFSYGRKARREDIDSALRLMWTSYGISIFFFAIFLYLFPEYLPFF